MQRSLLIVTILCGINNIFCSAQSTDYLPVDSIKIEQWLTEAENLGKESNILIHFSLTMKGTPYVANTLDRNDDEHLVVNIREIDCTTFVENILALAWCYKAHKTSFRDFCLYLRMIRYCKGQVGYINRLHYFSDWIRDNQAMGIVRERTLPSPPFSAIQTLNLNYMSCHWELYPMLKKHPEWLEAIGKQERSLSGTRHTFIPKRQLRQVDTIKDIIRDGDIIAIVTSKSGLDFSHLGIAIWQKGQLHMIHASKTHGKVIVDPLPLIDYLYRQTSQLGIRVITLP